jgi:serine/threonine/tyrosine-interacting protein
MEDSQLRRSTVVPTASFSFRPPSPPFISIPNAFSVGMSAMHLVPTFDHIDSCHLAAGDLEKITGNKTQIARDKSGCWSYGERRNAQAVVDFLYLGPLSVVKDQEWLRSEGITMILVARDARVAKFRNRTVEKAAEALGIEVEYVDVAGYHELISTFNGTVKTINDHLLSVYRNQAVSLQGIQVQPGQMVIDGDKAKHGKVLVVCETGNDRSAYVVAAYLMALYGHDMATAVQFIGIQRFCVNFDEDSKRILQSWEDILQARKSVGVALRSQTTSPMPPTAVDQPRTTTKRRIMETYDEEDVDVGGDFVLDRERYMGRESFVPFIDVPEGTLDTPMPD